MRESDIDRENLINLVSCQINDVFEGGGGDGKFKGLVSDLSLLDDVESGASSCGNLSPKNGAASSVCSVLGEMRSTASQTNC